MQAAERQTVHGTLKMARQMRCVVKAPIFPLGMLATFPAMVPDSFGGH